MPRTRCALCFATSACGALVSRRYSRLAFNRQRRPTYEVRRAASSRSNPELTASGASRACGTRYASHQRHRYHNTRHSHEPPRRVCLAMILWDHRSDDQRT